MSTTRRPGVGVFDLPPSKDSSYKVRLELKIEGVKHGKEIAFTGTDYQEIKDAIDGNDPPFTLCDGAPCICRKQEEVASEDLAIFVALHDVG